MVVLYGVVMDVGNGNDMDWAFGGIRVFTADNTS